MEQDLFNRFKELSLKINQCKNIIQNGASYTTIAQIKEWSDTMRTCATELDNLFPDTLRYLSNKLT